MLRLLLFAVFSVSLSFAFAQTSAQTQARVDTSKPIRFVYESKSWNRSSSTEDSAAFVLRDANSKRLVTIQVEETGPNTSVFVGQYTISWGDTEIIPEVYIPPQDLTKGSEQIKKIDQMIREGILLRKPFFFHSNSKSAQVIEVFDTKEQAMTAFEAYRNSRIAIDSPVGRPALEAQAHAAQEMEKKKEIEALTLQEEERKKLEAQEKIRQENLRKRQDQMAQKERSLRKAEAQKLGEKALENYKTGHFVEAETDFAKATELDPRNNTFYYQYGVTLYKNEKYNQSLANLALAQGNTINLIERDYYVGLNLMKLKEFDAALALFESVKNKKDKVLAPSASFFAGVLSYQKENFEKAKTYFEYTVDQSEDPNLDKQSEAYIEQIANILVFKKEQSKHFIANFNLGLVYDSNILSVANSQLNQPTDLDGFRWSYGGYLEYRPLYTVNHELSAVLTASDMYSTDKNFKAASNFQNTDPLLLSLYLPYRYKGLAFGKAYQMTVSPGVEQIQVNVDQVGAREAIVSSTVLKTDHTFVMKETWFATYTGELRRDRSLLSSSGDDDQSATKVSLGTIQTFFQDSKKTEAWVGELGAAQNSAAGSNSTYNRLDIAATYFAPWKWDTIWTARLGFYNANYSRHVIGRKDNDTSLTLALRKPFSPSLSGTLTGVYTNNSSTLPDSDYNKYLIMTSLSWTGFL